MIFEWDDFGCNHEISAVCQSHDCRDQLLRLKKLNPKFKATLFAIPAEMTMDLLNWCAENSSWIELAVHGFAHSSNYECEKWSYGQMAAGMSMVAQLGAFVKGFRAPGWQISDACYKWLKDHGWWVADQSYNDGRRPIDLKSYVNHNGKFRALGKEVEAYHGHTWNVGGVGSVPANGIYEDYDAVEKLVKDCKEFKFISEVMQ